VLKTINKVPSKEKDIREVTIHIRLLSKRLLLVVSLVLKFFFYKDIDNYMDLCHE
jgi:hypothetical protein